jgi:hypothetical protein
MIVCCRPEYRSVFNLETNPSSDELTLTPAWELLESANEVGEGECSVAALKCLLS